MSWAKVDDGFFAHPKVVRCSNAALGLWIRSLSYAATYLTDGFVPASFVDGDRPLARQLVTAGLWVAKGDGFRFHDYLQYQPSRAKVLEQRAAARERMESVRVNKSRTSREVRATGDQRSSRYRGLKKFARSSREVRVPRPVPLRTRTSTKDKGNTVLVQVQPHTARVRARGFASTHPHPRTEEHRS